MSEHICISHTYIHTYIYIYVYIRQMPGLCPEPQPRQATHHHHHHHHHQTLVEDLQNEDRSLTGVGELKTLVEDRQ